MALFNWGKRKEQDQRATEKPLILNNDGYFPDRLSERV